MNNYDGTIYNIEDNGVFAIHAEHDSTAAKIFGSPACLFMWISIY